MEERLNWKTPVRYGPLFDTFKSLYDMKEYIPIPAESNKRDFDKMKNKRCKFCNNTEPDTTFQNYPHKISRLLGNRFWYALDECDKCNEKFSKYESNLGDFFLLDRALMQSKKPAKSPKFRSPAKNFVVEHGDFYTKKGVYVKQGDKSNGYFTYDEATGELVITTKTGSFVPLYVYKALIKMALSLLPDQLASEYPELLTFLNDPAATNVPICLIMVYALHSDARFDFQALLFEKKETAHKIPKHYFCFYWLNNIIVLYLPCHQDGDLYGTIEAPAFLPVPPPLFLNIDEELLEQLPIQFFDQDLGSSELQKTEREVIIKMDVESMGGLYTTNIETGKVFETGKFDISRVTGIFISRDEENPTVYFNEDFDNSVS